MRQSSGSHSHRFRAPWGRIPLPERPDWVPPGIKCVPGGYADGRCQFMVHASSGCDETLSPTIGIYSL